jgi:protein TonB
VFEEVVSTDKARRLARRATSLIGSAAIQVVATALFAALFAASVNEAPLKAVEVKFVKGTPRPAPPPLAAPPRKAAPAPTPPRATARPPVAHLVQPRKVSEVLPPPGPVEPAPPEAPAGLAGVVGGATDAAEQAAAAPETPAFDPASMTRPVFVSGPDPAYTRSALAREVEGLMVVACVVTREGQVRDCRVLQGLPFMDAAVVQALERRRYRPATQNGVAVEVTYHFRLNLKLPR